MNEDEIIEFLLAEKQKQGLSYEKLAQLSNIATSTCNQLIRRYRRPSLGDALAILDGLGYVIKILKKRPEYRKSSPEEMAVLREAILDLKTKGLSSAIIAERLGKSTQTINIYLWQMRKMGYTIPRLAQGSRRKYIDLDELIFQDAEAGLSLDKIAEKHNLKYDFVYKRIVFMRSKGKEVNIIRKRGRSKQKRDAKLNSFQEQVLQLLNEGKSVNEISSELKVSYARVRYTQQVIKAFKD